MTAPATPSPMIPVNAPLLQVENLERKFPITRGLFRTPTDFVHTVDGVSFNIDFGESLGLVGESGCGKTTTGRMLVKLMEATGGRILLAEGNEAIDVAHIKREDMKAFRRRVQMIFQDPYESMNPRRTIYDTISEPLAVQGVGTVPEREERVMELLQLVGLTPPVTFMFRYPHELSGGQRQRVAIARALVLDPSFVVADEPTSMLDVSIRISIMDLMLKLGSEFDVSYLYITHDLAVARYMCDRIAVMYLGKIVELASTEELLAEPAPPIHQGAALGGAGSRSLVSANTGRDQGWHIEVDQPPTRLPFHRTLPLGCRSLPSERPPPAGGQGERALRGVLSWWIRGGLIAKYLGLRASLLSHP